VRAPDGTTIEVKASGYAQSWARSGSSTISFAGLPGRAGKSSWDAATNTTVPGFVADVYVFAVNVIQQHEPYDGLDVNMWRFHVLPGAVVARTGQGSMRWSTVIALGGTAVPWEQLRTAIADAAGKAEMR